MKRLFPPFLLICLSLFITVTLVSGQTPTPVPEPTPDPPNVEGTTLYLPVVMYFLPPLQAPYDMARFMGDGRLYEVQHSGGSQARHQTQTESSAFFHTKGNETYAEWEELWYDSHFIYRGTDTSPGNGMYYTLRDNGHYGSKWAPRFWNVGDVYERNPNVMFYHKSDCSVVVGGSQRSWLLFEAFHPYYTFGSGLRLPNVVQLAWLTSPNGEPEERYFYAENYGLVGWRSRNHGQSYISEEHGPGQRPDNKREVVPCLNQAPFWFDRRFERPLPYWPGNHRR